MTEWLPIDSAPKDGTDILLFRKPDKPEHSDNFGVTFGHWMQDKELRVDMGPCGGDCHCREYEYIDPAWYSEDGGFTEEHPPTHWQPLPSPPKVL